MVSENASRFSFASKLKFRFSIRSLLILIFVVAAVIAYWKIKSHFMNSGVWEDHVGRLSSVISIDVHLLFLATQVTYLLFASGLLLWYRRPKWLCFCVASHCIWASALGLSFLIGVSLNTWIGDSILLVVFYEPSVVLVGTIAIVAVSIFEMRNRDRARLAFRLLLAFLLLLAILGEYAAMLSLHAFVGALMAALAM